MPTKIFGEVYYILYTTVDSILVFNNFNENKYENLVAKTFLSTSKV